MKKKDILRLLKDFKDATYNQGYIKACDELMTHGDWPRRKEINAAKKDVDDLFERIKKEFKL